MREYTAIFICILICNVFICPKSFGQTDYTYKKGKSFKSTNALSMTDTIDLTSISSPIPYKKSRPGQIQTIACPVRLPGYVRGIFFSRDSRPGDFEWPNNTNDSYLGVQRFKRINRHPLSGNTFQCSPIYVGRCIIAGTDKRRILVCQSHCRP